MAFIESNLLPHFVLDCILQPCYIHHLLEDGARSGVPRRAAGNRSPREVRDPARRAL